ncbi:hypothetical protein OIU84_014915 [Salix udensis]|uniref:Uncharacterized protein n=1 Tax=Salix udensis TaxID=889485 RepID=A0AAD6JDZ6_9ROSI|nr:hypothetical protein OIU84_014915 [Salix udensis]
MAPPPGPYSGTSTLALVARVSAFSLGLVYGNVKLNETYRLEDSLKKQDASPDGKSGTLILCGSHKFNSRDYTSSGSYALLNLRQRQSHKRKLKQRLITERKSFVEY